jgi:hypothetical protein
MFAVALAALTVGLRAASASTGGTISLGAVGGSGSTRTVEVVTSAAVAPWSGFNIHIATALGGGLTLNSMIDVNGTLLTATPAPLCFGSSPAPGQRIFGCATIGTTRASIVAAGQLAVFTLNTTGNGCLLVHLVTVPGNQTTDTYTIDRATSLPQTNVVDRISKKILVGTGQNSDCPSTVGGISELPAVAALPSLGSSRGYGHGVALAGAAGALGAASVGAAGWRRWRR